MNFIIRLATVHDASLLSDLGRRLFFEAFGSVKPADDMQVFLAENYNIDKQTAELSDTKRITYLAFANTEQTRATEDSDIGSKAVKPVGYVTLVEKTPQTGVKSARPIQLHRLYVDGSFHGKGLAQQLMSLAVKTALEHGYSSLWLTVWVNNVRAKKFYEKFSFKRVGEARFVIGKTTDTDDVLEKELH